MTTSGAKSQSGRWFVLATDAPEYAGRIIEADTPEDAARQASRMQSVSALRRGVTLRIWPLDLSPGAQMRCQYERPAASNWADMGRIAIEAVNGS